MSAVFRMNKPKGITEPEEEEHVSAVFKQKPDQQYEEDLIPEQPEPKKKSFTESVYDQLQESEELEKQIQKHGARSLSRVAERTLGVAGDLESFINNLVGNKDVKTGFPTSHELQKFSEKATGGYTKAQNDFERKVDETVGDVASFALGRYQDFVRNLGIPIAANLAKEGVEKLGWDEKDASYLKMGTMFMLDLIAGRGAGGARGYSNRLFHEAEHSIPQGAMADATNLIRKLDALEIALNRGGTAASRTPALQKIEQIRNAIHGNQIDPRELTAFRRTINEAIEQQGGWNIETPPNIRRRATKHLQDVKEAIIDTGMHYGETQNPQFARAWQQANESARAINRSSHVTNFVEKNFGGKFKSLSTKFLFGLGGTGTAVGGILAPGAVATAGVVTGGLASVYQGAKVLQRVIQSPTLRRYYTNVVQAAAEGNTAQVTANLKILDHKLAEEEKKEKEKINKILKS